MLILGTASAYDQGSVNVPEVQLGSLTYPVISSRERLGEWDWYYITRTQTHMPTHTHTHTHTLTHAQTHTPMHKCKQATCNIVHLLFPLVHKDL